MEGSAAALAYESEPIGPEFDLPSSEAYLAAAGGMESLGRHVDGEIARLRDEVKRAHESLTRARTDAAGHKLEAETQARIAAVNLAAFYELGSFARDTLGLTEAQFEEVNAPRRRRALNAQVEEWWPLADAERAAERRALASVQHVWPAHPFRDETAREFRSAFERVGDSGEYPIAEA